MRITAASTLLGIVAAACGCWGDWDALYPDAGWDGTDTGDPPAPPTLIDGGGTGGGPIDGRLGVFAQDEVGQEVVLGARVLVVTGDATALEGETDEDGLALFDVEGLAGPVDVHILRDGYVLESVYGLDASSATFLLRPKDGIGDHPTASISGSVAGLDKIPAPDSDQYQIARIFRGRPLREMLRMRDPWFHPEATAVADVLPTSGATYEATIPAGAGILYVLGGLVMTWNTPDESDDVVSWTHIGMLEGLAPQAGEDIDGVDLALDLALPIEPTVLFTFGGLVGTYETTEAHMALDFGDAGTIWLGKRVSNDVFTFAAPNYYGDFAEGDILIAGTAGQGLGEASTLPTAYKLDRGMDNYEQWGSLADKWVLEADMAQAALGIEWDGEVLKCFPPTGFSFGHFVFIDEVGGELWRVTRFGDLPESGTALPDLPFEWGWAGVPEKSVRVVVWVERMSDGTDTAKMRFSDFADLVVDSSANEAVFEADAGAR